MTKSQSQKRGKARFKCARESDEGDASDRGGGRARSRMGNRKKDRGVGDSERECILLWMESKRHTHETLLPKVVILLNKRCVLSCVLREMRENACVNPRALPYDTLQSHFYFRTSILLSHIIFTFAHQFYFRTLYHVFQLRCKREEGCMTAGSNAAIKSSRHSVLCTCEYIIKMY